MFERLVQGLLATSPAEFVAVVAGVIYGLLAVRQSRLCWLFGGLSSGVLAVLAAQAQLPMQSMLQVAYVAMSCYGWRHWQGDADARQPAIGTWPLRVHLAIAAAIAVATALLAPLVGSWTQAAWPRLDTVTMLASLLATWMVARMRLENWLYWIAIDGVSLWLYGAQGLAFVALLYLIYLATAVYGWFEWRARMARQAASA